MPIRQTSMKAFERSAPHAGPGSPHLRDCPGRRFAGAYPGLNSERVLHAREGNWQNAERDLRSAVALADGAAEAEQLNPSVLEPSFTNYAHVLRVNHRTQEAKSMEARLAALRASLCSNAVADASQLTAARGRKER